MKPMKPMEPMKPMAPMKPMKPLDFGEPWWPKDLGQPSSAASQDGLRYAVFPHKQRLVVEQAGKRTVYDTGGRAIGGVQQQGGSIAATGPDGTVGLDALKVAE